MNWGKYYCSTQVISTIVLILFYCVAKRNEEFYLYMRTEFTGTKQDVPPGTMSWKWSLQLTSPTGGKALTVTQLFRIQRPNVGISS